MTTTKTTEPTARPVSTFGEARRKMIAIWGRRGVTVDDVTFVADGAITISGSVADMSRAVDIVNADAANIGALGVRAELDVLEDEDGPWACCRMVGLE